MPPLQPIWVYWDTEHVPRLAEYLMGNVYLSCNRTNRCLEPDIPNEVQRIIVFSSEGPPGGPLRHPLD